MVLHCIKLLQGTVLYCIVSYGKMLLSCITLCPVICYADYTSVTCFQLCF